MHARFAPFRPSLVALAVAPLALAVGAAAQDGAPARDPLLGDPLVINGETVPFDAVKRQIVFGPAGIETMRLTRLRIFIDEQIEALKKAGAPPARYTLEQADVDKAMADAEKQVDEMYKGQEIDLANLYPTRDPNWLENVRLTQLFNRIFLPENPHEYPQVTIDALSSGPTGAPASPADPAATAQASLYTHIVQDYDQRQADPSLPPDPVGKTMLAMITSQTVVKHLENSAQIVSDPGKLPEGVVMRVNGKDIKTDDLWAKLQSRVSPRDVDMAKRWIVNTRLLEGSLRESGHWLDDAAYQKAYDEYTEPYKSSPFSIESVAVRFQKFPTVDAYKTYFRIMESMKGRIRHDMREVIVRKDGEQLRAEARAKAERLVAEGNQQDVDTLEQELFEEAVQDSVDKRWDEQLVRTQATRTSKLAGDAKIQCDILLVSAYDFVNKKWKENGWEEAEKRTQEIVKELAGDLSWKDAVQRYSDFYDGPVPTEQAATAELNNKGQFRSINRNELMKRLDESVYSGFVFGETLTDTIFFDMPVGEIQEPIKGPYGYYIVRLYTRGGPKRMLDYQNPDQRELIEQDFVALRAEALVRSLISENEIYGIGS